MAGVAQAKGAGDPGGERNAEPARRPTTPIITGLAPVPFELYGAQTLRADQIFVDGDRLR